MLAFFRRPGHATVVAYAALFIALGGSAFAVTRAPENSVSSAAIVDGQVKRTDLAARAVATAKIARQAVTTGKLAPGAVTADSLSAGAVTTGKLAPGAVTADRLSAGAVTSVALGRGSVTGAAVGDGSLTGEDIDESSLAIVPNATSAANAATLSGLRADQFVQGTGTTLAGRATFGLGGGGQQQLLTIPGYGRIQGGCGSGGGAIGFANESGRTLRVYPFAWPTVASDLVPVTVASGAATSLFPSGVGAAGITILQIVATDTTDPRMLTVVASRDAQALNQCPVQALATTSGPAG